MNCLFIKGNITWKIVTIWLLLFIIVKHSNEINYYDMGKTSSACYITQFSIITLYWYAKITFASSPVFDTQQRVVKASNPQQGTSTRVTNVVGAAHWSPGGGLLLLAPFYSAFAIELLQTQIVHTYIIYIYI